MTNIKQLRNHTSNLYNSRKQRSNSVLIQWEIGQLGENTTSYLPAYVNQVGWTNCFDIWLSWPSLHYQQFK